MLLLIHWPSKPTLNRGLPCRGDDKKLTGLARQFMKQEPKGQVVKDLKVKLERVLRLLDQKLSTQPFMAGEVSMVTIRLL